MLEEEASLNINNLIKQARIEKSQTNNMSSAALNHAKMIQPDFCNEKRGYAKQLAPEDWGVGAVEPTMHTELNSMFQSDHAATLIQDLPS